MLQADTRKERGNVATWRSQHNIHSRAQSASGACNTCILRQLLLLPPLCVAMQQQQEKRKDKKTKKNKKDKQAQMWQHTFHFNMHKLVLLSIFGFFVFGFVAIWLKKSAI